MLEDKKKMEPEGPEEEQYKSFFEIDNMKSWEDDLLDEKEVREKVYEHKIKSMKERKRMGDGDAGKSAHHKR